MLFCSETFLLFFAVVFVLYWAMPWRQVAGLAAAGGQLLLLRQLEPWLALLIASPRLAGLRRRPRPRRQHRRREPRRLLVVTKPRRQPRPARATSSTPTSSSTRWRTPCTASADRASLPVLQVILPVGISFYTFEAINYTVDVYRRRIRPSANLDSLHAVHHLLPAPGGRADRPGPRLPAADPPAQALGLGPGRSWACSSS